MSAQTVEMLPPESLSAPLDAPDGYTSEGEAALAEDVKTKQKIEVPIVLSARRNVIDGHRRRRAAIAAGLKLVPVTVNEAVRTEEDEIAYTHACEAHRNGRNDAIHAHVIAAYMERHKVNGKTAAERFKLSPAKVSRLLTIARQPGEIIDALGRLSLTSAHLQVVSKVDEGRRLEMLRQAIAEKLSAGALKKLAFPPKRKAPSSKVHKIVEGELTVLVPTEMIYEQFSTLLDRVKERMSEALKSVKKTALKVVDLEPK